MIRRWLAGSWVLVCLSSVPLRAQESSPVAEDQTDLTLRLHPLVTVENRGAFRLRFNTFLRGDLGIPPDTSLDPGCVPSSNPVLPRQQSYRSVRDAVSSADLRLRWEPVIRVAEIASVHAIVDLLDNVVLGSTPDLDQAAAPLSTFARGQRAPSAAFSSFRDSLRIKAAWAEVMLFNLVHLSGGRMPEHFGLGIVRSGGRDPDSDFGDYVDGVFGKVNLGVTWLRFGLEFPGEGLTSDSPYGYAALPYDMDQTDDVYRWVFGVDSSPVRPEERRKKAADFEAGRPVYDWGIYNAITQQKTSSDRSAVTPSTSAGTAATSSYDAAVIVPRGAFFWTPSVWGKFWMRPRSDLSLRVEAEVAMTWGHVDHVVSSPQDSRSRKEFLSFGAALEAEVQTGPDRFFLWAGLATGGNTLGAFGVQDQGLLAASGAGCWNREHPSLYRTRTIHHFVFNRDYRVDQLLFREVIGSVTNAFYFKPGWKRTFWTSGEWALDGGVSLLMAFASIPEGTPGGKRPLGVEGGVDLGLRMGRHFSLQADGAVLFPLEGLDRPGDGVSPRTAGAIRVRAVAGF